MSACKSCGRSIFYAVSESTGSRIPMDMRPSTDGMFVPARDERGEVRRSDGLPIVRWLSTAQAMAYHGRRWSSHFATCPSATMHRRRKVRR